MFPEGRKKDLLRRESRDIPAARVLDDEAAAVEDLNGAPRPDSLDRRPAPGFLAGMLRTARPRQWIKNVLVFAAPAAAGVLTQADVFAKATGALGVFCLAASGTYFLNDALDVDADRLHPTKRHRPVAAGSVTPGTAMVTAAFLLVASVGAAYALAGWQLALVIGIYVALQPLYSLWWKHVAVLDLAAVASGFVLRAVAGGVAVDVPISQWFLIVASFGSLFMVAGKRDGEKLELVGAGIDNDTGHRATLGVYSANYLHYIRSLSSAVALAAYCLWAFEQADVARSPVWFQISIIPFVLGTLRYALLLDSGLGAAPEEIVLRDRTLQVLGLLWMTSFAIGVHVR